MRKNLLLLSKRFFTCLVTLFVLVSIIFLLIRITPGDPAAKYISPEMNPVLAGKVKASFNLDKPVLVQYTSFVKNMFTGDFGVSYEYHRPVFDVIADFLPFTAMFALLSFAVQFSAGVSLASFVVRKKRKLIEKWMDTAALGIYSLPSFIIGIGLIYFLSLKMNIFPSADLYSFEYDSMGFAGRALEIARHLVLPLITLSLPGIVVFYRYAKENILSLKESTFVLNLVSNGYSEKVIYRKHIFPNLMPQLISVSGVELSILFGGTLITEVLFNLPGMGRMTVTAILQRDYPLITASTFVSGIFVLFFSLLSEFIRGLIDKRLAGEYSI